METKWRYGRWLRRQAQRFRQPCVESPPWASLPDRLLRAWLSSALAAPDG